MLSEDDDEPGEDGKKAKFCFLLFVDLFIHFSSYLGLRLAFFYSIVVSY